jgi:hypothetical protein
MRYDKMCEALPDTTAAEADAWLARLEAGEDAEPPQPHR